MSANLLSRQQLEILNRRTLRYPLQVAEKDYFLAVVMKLISESPWGEILVFKGGTAIHHCYVDQYRFSEDLDFSSNGQNVSLEDVRSIFAEAPFLTIRKERRSEATVKIERLQYSGPLVLPNSLKLEIDVLQNVILPARRLKYSNVWGLDFTVWVMDAREMAAEKIRAMSERSRYRDYYDLFLLVQKFELDLNEIVSYISLKEMRRPVTKTNIRQNWMVVGTQKMKDMGQIYCSLEVGDDQIQEMIENLPLTEIRPSR